MSKLDEPINNLCPDGVEYKTIGDICNICRGIVMSKDFIRDNAGEYPVYSSQTENNGELGRIATYDFDGEYLTWTTDGANAGSVFYRNGKFSVTNVCGVLEIIVKTVSAKFLYYVLQTATKPYVNKGMGNPKLMSNVMARVRIPVPPIEVQREIVRILDKFTEMQQCLQNELTARKKQYEYYRDELLNAEGRIENAEWTTLEEVCLKTSNIKWKEQTMEYDYIDLTSVSRDNCSISIEKKINKNNAPSRAQQIVNTDDVLYATTRPTLQRYCIITEQFNNQICSTGFSILRPNKAKILPLYLYFVVASKQFLDHVKNNQEGTSYPAISDSKLKRFSFALPPFEEQERIVAILERFDKLCNDISFGLPAEIEARKKQYEYYRDKLLTFKKKAV